MYKTLDAVDVELMTLLQKDSKMPVKRIADHVYRSQSVVRNKIARLVKSGVIDHHTIKIDKTKIGINHLIIAAITLKSNKYEDTEAFKREILAMPSVLKCWRVSEACDFIVHFGVDTLADYSLILTERLHSMGNIAKISSMISLEEVRGSNKLDLNRLINLKRHE